jgi:hypothetical protein
MIGKVVHIYSRNKSYEKNQRFRYLIINDNEFKQLKKDARKKRINLKK